MWDPWCFDNALQIKVKLSNLSIRHCSFFEWSVFSKNALSPTEFGLASFQLNYIHVLIIIHECLNMGGAHISFTLSLSLSSKFLPWKPNSSETFLHRVETTRLPHAFGHGCWLPSRLIIIFSSLHRIALRSAFIIFWDQQQDFTVSKCLRKLWKFSLSSLVLLKVWLPPCVHFPHETRQCLLYSLHTLNNKAIRYDEINAAIIAI